MNLPDPHGDDPRMVTLTREGKEIACVTASDGPDCCIEAAVMLLNRKRVNHRTSTGCQGCATV
jgi:hypothetical protein